MTVLARAPGGACAVRCPACRTAGAARGGPRWDASAGAPDPAGFDMDAETMIWTPTYYKVNTNGKLIIYDLFRHIRSAWARPRVTNARPRGRARTRKPQLKRWPVGLGPPAAARTSLVRSTKNETLTKLGLHLCLSVKLCLSVPLRSACECSVAEERTAEARVRRARTAPSMGRKELPTHAKQPSSIALCSRLRS